MGESLLTKIKRTTRLPSPPGTALEILRLCQREDIEIGQLADTLAADPALSLRLLKYANSPLVGLARGITSVREAVVLLGIRAVRLMALSFSLVSSEDRRACRGFDYGLFWAHSVARAVAARHLAARTASVVPEEAFAAGLLAQVGKLVLAVCLPRPYAEILAKANGTLGDTSPYEIEHFGASHLTLGADLLLDWGIPTELADAVRFQHQPDELKDRPESRALADIIRAATVVADIICEVADEPSLEPRWTALVDSAFFQTREQVAEAIDAIRREYAELASLLSLNRETAKGVREIEAEAGEVLGELSLAAQLKSDAVEKENIGLQERAWTDGLTGIGNRAAFDRRLTEMWNQAVRERRAIGLIMLDVDHFKQFNDTYGHQTGDAILKAVAGCLRQQVRQVDFVARYGGEEFAVITPNTDRLTAAQICVKIRKAIETNVVEFRGQRHQVTLSVGAAVLPVPEPPFTPKELIEAADQQLYRSKEKGRNCCSMKQLAPGPETAVTA